MRGLARKLIIMIIIIKYKIIKKIVKLYNFITTNGDVVLFIIS